MRLLLDYDVEKSGKISINSPSNVARIQRALTKCVELAECEGIISNDQLMVTRCESVRKLIPMTFIRLTTIARQLLKSTVHGDSKELPLKEDIATLYTDVCDVVSTETNNLLLLKYALLAKLIIFNKRRSGKKTDIL